MKRVFLFGFLTIAVLATGTVAYILRPPEEASAPIEAVPLVVETEPAAESTATAQEGAESATAAPSGDAASAGLTIYAISQEESAVRFSIDELLRNVPTTAVGVTDQVAGEIAISFEDPALTQVGQITVNARGLATDSTNRNRMIQNEILDTAAYEFIVFTPTAVTGLPEQIVPGEMVEFVITGDLTIRAITVETSFAVSAVIDAGGRLSGTATAVVLRSDYGLVIPSVPSVADVSDEVLLEIDFVAYPK